ncbi:hypothetical protein [Nonomuraea sp. NPDC046570]|uniref:hypothetical protein n=1 Tax=Nonomuraea sp. NPDC046570 TaxID=3155255 RepID=UPI0033C92CEC
MTTTTALIVPGLTVTAAMYEVAAAGIELHSPDVGPLTWETWTDPARWTLVPDEQTMRAFKAEFTLRDYADGTLRRINLWHEPDLRGGASPKPHSHPWPFIAHVLAGGYSEQRYTAHDRQPTGQRR